MANWSHGYNISEGYTYGFYREVTPNWIDFSLAVRGIQRPPRCAAGRYRYLELGCGQGFGLCLIAAANPNGDFVGIDFSPEHVTHAQQLAATLGLRNVVFLEADFERLVTDWPASLGSFSYVALHGIYSWVSVDLRHAIARCLDSCVSPGGVVYLSYNTMPGWTPTIPFQHILRLLDRRGRAGGARAVERGRALFQDLEAVGSSLTKALPTLKSRVASTGSQSPAYLVQEYLHDNWHPLWSSQVHAELSMAKLTRAGTATLAENLLPSVLPEKHREIVDAYEDPVVREDLLDAVINQTFRRDLYTRGGLPRLPGDQGWRQDFHFWRANDDPIPEQISVKTSFGTIAMQAKKYAFIFGAVGDRSATIDDLLASAPPEVELGSVVQVLLLLTHSGWLTVGSASQLECDSLSELNQRLASAVARGGPYRYLAGPRAGTAVHASDLEMLLLDAYNGKISDFAPNATSALKARLDFLGKRLVKDGEAIGQSEENKQLLRLTETFITRTLPIWRRLGVTD
jgi:SAM-dependent methyltransferase